MQKNKIFLFLDYDGTLTPIVSKPRLAKLSTSRRAILKKLARNKDIKIAIVTGRSQKDVKSMVKISGIHYVGNHGFQIDKWVHPKARSAKKYIKKILSVLKKRLQKIKGVIFEDKGFTASIHYRLVKSSSSGREVISNVDRVFEIFKEVVDPYLRTNKIKVTYGKKVFEIRPSVSWDKGKAVLQLLNKKTNIKYFPIYIGDDVTDEDAFIALRGRGETIYVGKKVGTNAQRCIDSVDSVYHFLNTLKDREKLEG